MRLYTHTLILPTAPFSPTAEFDCVACCYFIDTANNVIEYLQTIHKILKPGGYWINFGKPSISQLLCTKCM